MTDLLKLIPSDAWIITAVAVAGLILMIGARIMKSSKTTIDIGPVDISIDKTSSEAAATPANDTPQTPAIPPPTDSSSS